MLFKNTKENFQHPLFSVTSISKNYASRLFGPHTIYSIILLYKLKKNQDLLMNRKLKSRVFIKFNAYLLHRAHLKLHTTYFSSLATRLFRLNISDRHMKKKNLPFSEVPTAALGRDAAKECYSRGLF